jgi:hypothetical protein
MIRHRQKSKSKTALRARTENVTAPPTRITSHTESWISFDDAAKALMARRRIKIQAALPILRKACLFDKIGWRHNPERLDERGRLQTHRTTPDMLTLWSELRLNTIHPLEKQIEIRESDLSLWPVKPRRGPEPGSISRFADDDRALFSAMAHIIQRDSKSSTEAARDLAHERKIKGRGTPESRALRLARLYRKEYRRRAS